MAYGPLAFVTAVVQPAAVVMPQDNVTFVKLTPPFALGGNSPVIVPPVTALATCRVVKGVGSPDIGAGSVAVRTEQVTPGSPLTQYQVRLSRRVAAATTTVRVQAIRWAQGVAA